MKLTGKVDDVDVFFFCRSVQNRKQIRLLTIDIPINIKPTQTPKLRYLPSLAGSYQGPVLAKDAILLDKTRAVLWHNYKNCIWQKEKQNPKNNKQ